MNNRYSEPTDNIDRCRHLARLLYQSRQRLEIAEQIAGLGYWELDLGTRTFYWSDEMFRVFGQRFVPSRKRNLIREGILPEDMPIYKRQLKLLLQTKTPVEGEIRIKKPSGEISHCLFRAALLNSGERRRIVGTVQDISSAVYTEQAMQASDKAKTLFLAQASHDLRQPMQALQLFIQSLAEEELNYSQKCLVQKISASAANLKSLLDNMLDISKLDSGGFKPEFSEFDVGDLFCRLCREYRQITVGQNIRIICRVRHFGIYADAVLIERIVRNLFGNALKYTKNRILLSCQKEQNNLKIRVIDNGVGISLAEQTKVFEEFYQNKDIEGNRNSGAGLGLSIVRRIVKLLGGKVRVRSGLGHYTAFEVTLPVRAGANR